jgi:hypothetical protein
MRRTRDGDYESSLHDVTAVAASLRRVSPVLTPQVTYLGKGIDSMVSQLLLSTSLAATELSLHYTRVGSDTDDATLRYAPYNNTDRERKRRNKKHVSRYHQTTSLFSPSTSLLSPAPSPQSRYSNPPFTASASSPWQGSPRQRPQDWQQA